MNTGIYKITNLINNKFYIGSAAISFKKRWKQHICLLNKNKHRNRHLQRSWNKYGKENFKFEIIEKTNSNLCIEREQHYIDLLKPDYNIARIAGSSFGIKRTKEYCDNISKRMKNKPAWNKGKPFSTKTKQKMSESRKRGLLNGTIIIHNKGKKSPKNKPIIRNDGKIYQNIPEAANDLKVKENTIIKACTDKNQIRRVKGYILTYIT